MSDRSESMNPVIEAWGMSVADVTAAATGLQSFVAQATVRAAAMQMEMFSQMLRGEYTGHFPEVSRG